VTVRDEASTPRLMYVVLAAAALLVVSLMALW
jgi:hypothetical protein